MNLPNDIEPTTLADRSGVTDLVSQPYCLQCGNEIKPREMKGRQQGWQCDNCDPVTLAFNAHLHAVMEELKVRRAARTEAEIHARMAGVL